MVDYRFSVLRVLKSLVLVPAMLLLLPSEIALSDSPVYEFEKSHSTIRFIYDHLGMTKQDGRFLDYTGKIVFEELAVDESSVDVTIKADSISTNVKALDEKLRGKDYFNSEKYPEITFKSTSVKQTSAKNGQIKGDLTINGITKPVVLDVTFNFAGKHPLAAFLPKYKDVEAAAFSARTSVLRSDFGMKLFAPMVSDEVTIEIEAELVKVK